MSEGIHGHGTVLAGSGAGTIGNIINVDTGMSRDVIDKSTMDSTSKAREKIAGMLDAGDLSLTINYDGSAAGVANALHTAFLSGTPETWTITYPDTSTHAFSGFISALGAAAPFDDKITQTVTIALTGVPTFTDVA